MHSDADAFARHVREADEAVCVGRRAPVGELPARRPHPRSRSRRRAPRRSTPGTGFSASAPISPPTASGDGIRFIGPTAEQIREFGLKHRAREIAATHGVPLLPGTPLLPSAEAAVKHASAIGYPVILKSTAGGGGIGLRVCRTPGELADAFESVERLGKRELRRVRRVPREVRRARAARRGADLRRRPRRGRRPGRARLLGPAAQPEGDRGDARAGSLAGDARAALRRARSAWGGP